MELERREYLNPQQEDLAERKEYLPFLNTLSESDALTRQVERSLLTLRDLLTTPRRLERLGHADHDRPEVGRLPRASSAPDTRPRSAVPAARPFVRPPNVPEVPLPLQPVHHLSQSSFGPDDLASGTSLDSGSSRRHDSPPRAQPCVKDEPAQERWSRRSPGASGRGTRSPGASGRGTRSGQGTQRSRPEEERNELTALCAWILRRYRSGPEACAVLLDRQSRLGLEQFAKALVREGYPGRAAAAARALDWRGRGNVRSADLVAHVEAFFQRNKSTPTKERREARPLSAPAVGARR